MNMGLFRIGVFVLAVVAGLAAAGLWWADGAWQNGAMPTDGLVKVLALAGGGLACVFAAAWLDREKKTNRRPRRSRWPCR